MVYPDSESNREYSKYDSMSTEALEEILRQDFLLPDGESDLDAVLYITQLLAERERAAPSGNYPDVEAAWKSFVENYLPYACAKHNSLSAYSAQNSTKNKGGCT